MTSGILLATVLTAAPLPATLPAAAPEARSGHRMAFDAQRQVTVLFGGWSASEQYLGDTWTWDGRAWSKVAEDGPSPRAWYALAYDDRAGRVLLFGGRNADGAPQGDTWEWNGEAWRMLSAEGPSPRDHTAMAFDSARGRLVLYGGFDPGSGLDATDTWEWDGRWQKAADRGPAQVAAHSMEYLEALGGVVLFGGLRENDVVASSWTWNGTAWREWSTNRIEGRSHSVLTRSPRSGALLRFGGKNSERVPFGDTWELRGRRWKQRSGSGPPPRIDHAAAYDSRRERVVLFGGKLPSPDRTRFGDTWEWDGRSWIRRGAGAVVAPARPDPGEPMERHPVRR